MVTVYKVINIGMLFAVKTELSKTVFSKLRVYWMYSKTMAFVINYFTISK